VVAAERAWEHEVVVARPPFALAEQGERRGDVAAMGTARTFPLFGAVTSPAA
jgi:hypothetical protein